MNKRKLPFRLPVSTGMWTVFSVFIFLCVLISDANSQPLKLGQSVVTSYTFDDTGMVYNVVRVIDIRNHPPFTVAAGTYWNAPPQYVGPNWTRKRMRDVYGIAIDNETPPNFFISSTSVNCDTPDPNDSALIYRIDANTWLATTYIFTTFAPGPPASGNGVSTMPNTGPRIGNICYDNFHKQLFATNLEDGIIYRIKDNGFGVGNVEEYFDPSTLGFNPDDGTAGFAPFGERLWGIGSYGTNSNDVKVYFSRWVTSSYVTGVNEIWSVNLSGTGNFIPSTLAKVFAIDGIVPNDWSSPVADIEFSFKGDMLLGERSMSNNCSAAHASRILEYPRDISGNYNAASYILHNMGMLFNYGIFPNSTGGVDYDYGFSDSTNNTNIDCDSTIVGTGDYLFMPSGGGLVYGVQATSRSNAWTNNSQNYSDYVDINNNIFTSNDKTTPGDIDVYRKDLCSNTTCIKIVSDTTYCDSTGTYIYQFQVFNNSPTRSIEQLEIGVDSPQPPNYVVAIPSNINITPALPPRSASQVYKIKLIGPGAVAYAEVCYTLSAQYLHTDCPWCCFIENCIKLPICSCAEVLKDSIYCQNDQYYYNFTLQNGTQYTVTKIQLTSPGSTPITFIPQIIHFTPPISPGQNFPNQTALIIGGVAGQTIPVKIKLFSNDFECCYFELMYTLPPCDTLHLNLKSFIEGRYDPSTNTMVGDNIQVELRNSYSPYSLVESASGYLSGSGTISLEFYNAVNETNYYLVVRNSNSLETWSKSPGQSFSGDVMNFDFLSNTQAYGNNLRLIDSSPLRYGLISGDVNQDGVIDLADIVRILNDSKSFDTGVSDLNGDGVTNLADLTIAYNNV
ncbi:MAG: dockerin type I repeat-containing protein, partial [Ignavibacteria bacterium]